VRIGPPLDDEDDYALQVWGWTDPAAVGRAGGGRAGVGGRGGVW